MDLLVGLSWLKIMQLIMSTWLLWILWACAVLNLNSVHIRLHNGGLLTMARESDALDAYGAHADRIIALIIVLFMQYYIEQSDSTS